MRTVLAILLAFIAGVAITLAWTRHTTAPVHPGSPTTAQNRLPPAPRKHLLSPEAPPALLPDRGWPADAPTPEQVMAGQPQRLDDEFRQLKARTVDRTNLYALVFAGDGSENVFRNEAEYFDKLFTRRFGAAGHVVVLENSPATLDTRPLADWSNLEDALDVLAEKMDPRQDILLLYFTSHGGDDHSLLVDMDPLPLDQIGAQDLADILKVRPFRWKVVVVNACFSGGFIPPLHGAGSLIITAARSDRTSFGCGAQSQITYFSHAFLVDALNRTDNFARAFQLARAEVGDWEKRDGFTPSEPQIDIGAGITGKLAQWRSQNPPGAAVAFQPAAPNHARAHAGSAH